MLPAEVIISLPNANVADALGRMSGVVLERAEGEGEYIDVRGLEPRLTNITIDGITIPSPEPTVRQIRLDVINSDLVEAVEINKTLSANQDGDGIAGSVNLRTKTATDQPLFSVYANGGYTPILNGRGVDQFGGIFGRRFGDTKKFGFVFGGTYDYNGRGIDNIQPGIDPLSTFAQPFYDNNSIRQYRYYRTRYGFSGSADYKVDDNNSFYAHGLYSDLKDWGDKWYYEPKSNPIECPATGPCNPSTYIYPSVTGTAKAPKFYTSSKRPNASIGSLALGGSHVGQSSWLTWEICGVTLLRNRLRRQPQGRLRLAGVETGGMQLQPGDSNQSQHSHFRGVRSGQLPFAECLSLGAERSDHLQRLELAAQSFRCRFLRQDLLRERPLWNL